MMKELSKHAPHYISLFGIIILAIVGFYIFSWDRAFQIAILVGVAVAYVAWGAVHHSIHKNFSLSVFLEYVVVATLGLTVVLSLILRT